MDAAQVIEPAHAGQDVDEAAVAARELSGAERALVGDLVRQARAEGVALTGPDGLLKALTKTVLEAALQEEMTEHLGYDRHAAAGRGSGNSRNGSRNKKVITDACGQVEIAVLRDRNGTFEPVIVGKRKRRVTDVDRVVLSLYAKGLTTGEIAAHFADVYGVSVSKDTISRITDRVIEEMQAWWSRPLEKVYAAVFIDAIMVKIRDGQVRNRPVYAAIGVDLDGHKDILGMWAGEGDGESAKFWLAVLTDLRNRGVKDIFFLVCDGLKGLPDSVSAAFPLATVQTCIIHLIRNTFRYASRKYWDKISVDLKPIYTAASAAEARLRYEEFAEKWGKPYQRSHGCGTARGKSSFRSWTMMSKYGESRVLPTQLKVSMRATGGRCGHVDTSRTNSQHSRRSTWSPAPWIPRAPGKPSGPYAGSQRSTPWRSRSPIACQPPKNADRKKNPEKRHLHRISDSPGRRGERLGFSQVFKGVPALVAQGIEHGSPKAGVAGSNPAGGTLCLRSSAMVFRCQPSGRGLFWSVLWSVIGWYQMT